MKARRIGISKVEIGEIVNKELGVRKGSIIGKAFLYPNKEKGYIESYILDKEADTKIEGAYKDRRNPICPNCFIRKTRRGDCNC